MTYADAATELRFDLPGPGFWEQDPVHFPRPLTRYWTEVHPTAFKRGTGDGSQPNILAGADDEIDKLFQ